MKRKRLLALTLALTFLTACTPKSPEDSAGPSATPAPTETPAGESVRVAMLKGPTGLGAAKLMADNEAGESGYTFEVLAEPTEAVAKLTKGEVDIAALPTNLASVLYHKLDGGIQLMALNTRGVLYILEKGNSVQSMEDLRGKTIHAFGQGANPEFVLNCLLEKNGLVPGEDVDIQWYSSTDEVAAQLAGGEAELALLPVPAATGALMKNEAVRVAIDLNDVWEEAELGGVLTMGCVVVRTQFAQEHPAQTTAFLEDYGASIAYMSAPDNLALSTEDNPAQLAQRFGILPKAEIAAKAIPDANLCFLTGEDMMEGIQSYYQVLYAADPASIGGSIPDGAFYYLGGE